MIFILSLGMKWISYPVYMVPILRVVHYNTGKLDLNLHLFISHVAYSTYMCGRSIYLYAMHFFAIKLVENWKP